MNCPVCESKLSQGETVMGHLASQGCVFDGEVASNGMWHFAATAVRALKDIQKVTDARKEKK